MSKEVANEYSSSLADLTVNSKPLINMLTMLADENIDHAPAIVQVVEKHLAKVRPEIKLPVLYLIDSIVKNVGRAYVSLFTQNIVSTFCSVFEKVDEHTRAQMFKLRQTWNEIFPPKKLYAVDVRVNSMDPAWPITAPTPTSIHLNPRFLSMAPNSVQPANTVQVMPTQPQQPTSSVVQNSTPESGTGSEAQQALTEAQMREQLLRKQKELLELQQRKLELELLQTKARLEDQQRQLQVKEQQRQVEQCLLPSAQKIEENASKVVAPKLADQKKTTSINKSSAQVSTAEEVEKTPKPNFDSKTARDPRLNRQPGTDSGNFNYSGSNMLPPNVISEIAKSKIANKNPVVSTLNKDPRLGKDPRLNKITSDVQSHLEESTSNVTTSSTGYNPQSTLSSFQSPLSNEGKRKSIFLPISSSTAKNQYPQQKTLSPQKSKKGTNGQVTNKGKPTGNTVKVEEGASKSSKASEALSKTVRDEKLNTNRKGTDNRNDNSPRKLSSTDLSSHPPSPLKSDNHRPPRTEHSRKLLGKTHDALQEKKDGRKKDSLFKGSSSKSPPTSTKGSPDSKRKRDRKKDVPGQRQSPRKSPSLASAPTDKGSGGMRDGESDNRTFKGLKNSRNARNYMRRNQESSRSPSPCEFPSAPLPNSSLKQMPPSDTPSGTALGPKIMGDVDLRHCQTTLGGPSEKLPRLAVYTDGLVDKDVKDEEKKLLPSKDNLLGDHEDRSKKTSGDADVINKDVDLRHISRSPPHGKKRPSMEKGDHPPTKKSKAEMFDVLFGNEDVDLRQLSTIGAVALPSSAASITTPTVSVETVVSVAPSTSTISSPSKRETVPPPPLPPLPLTRAVPAPTVTAPEDVEMVPVSLDENLDRKKKSVEDDMVADRAKLWAKYKEVNPDTYKSPLKPSWKAFEGDDRGVLLGDTPGEESGRAVSPRGPGRGAASGVGRGNFGRLGRTGSFRRLPGDTRDLLRSPSDTDMRSTVSPSKRLPGLDDEEQSRPIKREDDDDDVLAGQGTDLGANPSSLNISIIVAQADEQLKNGTMSFAQYNTLLKQVIHLNEIQKLREAQRREDEHERDEWDSGGESPIDQWDLDKRKTDEDTTKRREDDGKEDDLRNRSRGKDGRPIGMEGEVPLLGRNFPPAHDKPILGMHGDIDERIQPPVSAIVGSLGTSSMDKSPLHSNLLPEVQHQPPHLHSPMVSGGPGGTPPWREEGQPSQVHVNRRWENPSAVGQWSHHPGHGPPFSQSAGVGPKTPGDLLPIRRDFTGPPSAGGFVGPGPRWAHPPPIGGPPFRDEEGVYHHGPDRFGGPPLPPHAGHNRFRLRELPPPDRAELAAMENDRMKTINIDGVPREIRFYGDTAIIMMRWDDPRELCFQGGSRRVTFDGGPEGIICSFGEGPREVLVSGRPHSIRLGSPTRELCIDGRWYECHFGGPPMPVDLDDGRRHYVELAGPPPQVRIGTDRRTDLVAGKINLIIDARDMVPIFLDAKPQCFEIEGRPHTLRFTHALRYVVINGRHFRVEFGGLPMPIIVRDRKHFIRFSVLPRGIMPGYVSIAGMEGGRLPSPLPPPSQGPSLVQGNVPVDDGPRPITEEITPDHRRVPFESGLPEPDDVTKPLPTTHKFTGHEPAMPMLGSASRGRMQHTGRRPFDAEHLRHNRRPSPNRTNIPPHLRPGSSEIGNNQPFIPNQQQPQGSTANRGTSNVPQGPQLPLELLTSLMPVSVAPATGFSYQVQQDSSSEATKKDSDAGSSESSATKFSHSFIKAVAETSNGLGKSLPGLGGIEINVDALFQRLVATGILPQSDNSSADSNKKEDIKSNYKADFSPECLKSRHSGVISAIYTGIQCSSCGVRFPPEQTMKYSQHLDWHFRQNRRDRDSARKAQSRKWYYDVSDWIQFEEMEDLEERAQSWFETQGVSESKDDRAGATGTTAAGNTSTPGTGNDETTVASVPAGEKAEDQHCAVCREGFEQFYNEEKEEWHLKDAVRVEGDTYHPVCYEDYKASLEASIAEATASEEIKDEGDEEEEKKDGGEDVTMEDGEKKTEQDGEKSDANESAEGEDKKAKEDEAEGETPKDTEGKPDEEELLKNVKQEPKDEMEVEATNTENEEGLENLVAKIKVEPGVSTEGGEQEIDVKEPMESEAQDDDDEKHDEEMEEVVEPVPGTVDTTLNVVACSIDGNVKLEDTLSVSAPVGGRIKINISKSLVPNPAQSSVNTSESQETTPPGIDDGGSNKESVEEGVKGDTDVEGNTEMVDEDAQVAPPPPGVGTLRLKPRLIGRKLTELPPVMKGTELSGLCSIM